MPGTELLSNPFAPTVYNGFNDNSPLGFVDVDFTYPYDVTLTSGQFLRDQSVSTTNDADFEVRGYVSPTRRGTTFLMDSWHPQT